MDQHEIERIAPKIGNLIAGNIESDSKAIADAYKKCREASAEPEKVKFKIAIGITLYRDPKTGDISVPMDMSYSVKHKVSDELLIKHNDMFGE